LKKGSTDNERIENMFGMEKIKNILFDNRKKSPDEILKCILDELKNYDTDDVTVLVIKKVI